MTCGKSFSFLFFSFLPLFFYCPKWTGSDFVWNSNSSFQLHSKCFFLAWKLKRTRARPDSQFTCAFLSQLKRSEKALFGSKTDGKRHNEYLPIFYSWTSFTSRLLYHTRRMSFSFIFIFYFSCRPSLRPSAFLLVVVEPYKPKVETSSCYLCKGQRGVWGRPS